MWSQGVIGTTECSASAERIVQSLGGLGRQSLQMFDPGRLGLWE